MNRTRPLPLDVAAAAGAGLDSAKLRSSTLALAASSSFPSFFSDPSTSIDSGSSVGADEALTGRAPPWEAWKVFLGIEDTLLLLAGMTEGAGAGVG